MQLLPVKHAVAFFVGTTFGKTTPIAAPIDLLSRTQEVLPLLFSAARFQLAEPRSCQSFVVTTVTVTVKMNLTKILQILSFFSTSFSLALALALLSFSIA